MEYFLISIQYVNDGTTPCGIFAYGDEDSAVGAFHSTLASNYANPNLNEFLCMVIDDNGVISRSEKWTKKTNS